eukprot:scaffold140157_cov18-Tisochrysis_lutea.AAC.1
MTCHRFSSCLAVSFDVQRPQISFVMHHHLCGNHMPPALKQLDPMVASKATSWLPKTTQSGPMQCWHTIIASTARTESKAFESLHRFEPDRGEWLCIIDFSHMLSTLLNLRCLDVTAALCTGTVTRLGTCGLRDPNS